MVIKLVSSDLNGTLVHQHTMSDMIRLYLPADNFAKADAIFRKQTSGSVSMQEAFETAGPLTAGLILAQAVEYAQTEMKYLQGFSELVGALAKKGIPFVINSTGYLVTLFAIRARWGADKIQGFIGNRLEFALDQDPEQVLRDDELEQMVISYCHGSDEMRLFSERVKATGKVELGIVNEAAKTDLLFDYARTYFPTLNPDEMVHLGDTMGDSEGIYGVAKAGGLGIAFNYNAHLEDFLRQKIIQDPSLAGRIAFIEPKSQTSDLRKVIPFICGTL